MFNLTGRPESSGRRPRWIIAVIGAALGVVILAPVALSFSSLVAWAEAALGLNGPWPYIVPVALDAAALLSMALTFHAVTHAESATFPRALVWVFALGSAFANHRHGETVGPDAAIFFPAMPIAAAVLLEVTLRRVRRTVLAELGVTERPLARFRLVRWARFPRETFAAWSTAVEHGLSSPIDALAVAARIEPLDADEIAHAVESRNLAALPSDAARVRRAATVTGQDDPGPVVAWLGAHGHPVTLDAARSALRRRPAARPPVPVSTNGHPVIVRSPETL
ncbi:hypothetical protein Psed_7020 (plasmid) [Pseudonocardia dioxanivorans CB1190]|uniref:DUF2637 domain-containing protein n=1 Tax=Pseudonocardia dioxanivorans (strain ATCC 55486 / DSM 44775 / JCM 13855 / CB1190) TaxID=675635 RepID=F2L7A4_PSEUX|nr:DUF2637 domain-containing protein [Pseudonocardia dioxanivorans]AEA29077.1 hypothetical protein Psed_7020 [Pseudonocardia dioxanivorans CB1190]